MASASGAMAKHEQILVLDPPTDLKFKGGLAGRRAGRVAAAPGAPSPSPAATAPPARVRAPPPPARRGRRHLAARGRLGAAVALGPAELGRAGRGAAGRGAGGLEGAALSGSPGKRTPPAGQCIWDLSSRTED